MEKSRSENEKLKILKGVMQAEADLKKKKIYASQQVLEIIKRKIKG